MAKTLQEVKTAYVEKALSKPCGAYAVFDPTTGKVAANSAKPFRHTFDMGATWVDAQQVTTPLYRSADGSYYEEASLPEQTDTFVKERYTAEMRSERNARISDTDSYVQLTDVTVQKASKSKREALTDEEKQAVLDYRTALRDLPETSGWPFVDFPSAPSCIAVEVQSKIDRRELMRNTYAR